MNNKAKEINVMKVLMMIFVVLYHSCIFFTKNWFPYVDPIYRADYLKPFTFWLNTFHVQGFMMCSGYLFFFLKERGKYNDKKEFITKKIIRLILPLYCTLLFWIIPFHIAFYGFNWQDILKNYLLLYSPRQLWFLPCLFFISCFFEIFYDRISISKRGLIICATFCTIVSAVLSHFGLLYFQIANTIKFFTFFYFGAYVYYDKDKLIKLSSKKIYITSISLILLIVIYNCSISSTKILNYISTFAQPFLSCLELIIIYNLCCGLIENEKIVNNKIFNMLIDNSFGVYLFHQQIIYVIIVVLNGVVHPLLQCLACFLVSLVISLIISIILKKNKKTKYLFGL